MTDRPPQLKPKISTAHRDGAAHALVLRAKFAIFWERIAPVLLVIGAPAFTIFVISLFDAWRFVPQWVHLAALVAAGAATAYAAVKVRESRFWPTRTQALKRLERDGGVRHDGVQSLEDAPAGGGADNPLWAAHLEQSAARARRARIGRLRETLNARDRFGLRYAALALMLVGIISAGGDFGARIARGLTPGDPRAVMPGFADLWVEPPPYTGKAPVYLLGGDETLAGKRELISLPEGAVAIAQVKSRSGLRFGVKTAAGFTPAEKEGPARSARARLVLHESGVITLRAGGREGRWPVEIIADRPPQAEFSAPPQADDAGRLAVAARFDDDYGVAEASLRLRLVADQDRPLDAPAFDAQTTNASRLIALDGAAGPSGERRFTLDLQSDPWAGLEVEAVLIAADAAGKTGESAPVKFTLPEKPFFNPLARAVVEQRQNLAVAPTDWRRVEWAFSGLTLGPQFFYERTKEYLLMRTAMWRVNTNAGGDYTDTVEEFWPLALQLEDEALELARRRLEAANEALREALERGASDSELERLTEEMRSALQQYLSALAESGQQMAQSGPPPDETLNSTDLDAMLDAIRDLAKSGAQNAARQALNDLENLLNNLRLSSGAQAGRDGAQGGPNGDSGGNAGRAGDIIGRQRDLANRSFQRGQQRDANGDDLAEEQGSIAGDVSSLLNDLEAGGGGNSDPNGPDPNSPDPDGEAARALNQALAEMRRSQEALRADQFDAANEAMERAIEALREGGRELAEAAGERGGAARGQGEGVSVTRDPLGRAMGQPSGDGVEVPDKTDAQRARELLEELRRRLSNGERTQDEIDYLERLLERF